MKRVALGIGAALVAVGLVVGVAPGWWVKGHGTIAEAAAARLPEGVPAFFRNGGKALNYLAGEPDRWKNKETAFLRKSEEGNHFLDLEDLDGNAPPATHRYDFVKMLNGELKKDANKVGTLPYAIVENYERLTTAFYDARKEPENPAVPMKCLVYGGVMSHYTGDAAMPLHTTRDYDGRNQPDGTVKQKGIHARLDGFPEKFGITPEEVCRGLEAKAIDKPWEHVQAFLAESHTHVPTAYELDLAGAFAEPTVASRAFVLKRCRAGAQLTLDLWYTAWVRSEKLPAAY